MHAHLCSFIFIYPFTFSFPPLLPLFLPPSLLISSSLSDSLPPGFSPPSFLIVEFQLQCCKATLQGQVIYGMSDSTEKLNSFLSQQPNCQRHTPSWNSKPQPSSIHQSLNRVGICYTHWALLKLQIYEYNCHLKYIKYGYDLLVRER